MGQRRSLSLAVVLAALDTVLLTSPAAAGITFVQDLGSATANGGLSATIVATGAVTAGNSIIVFVATNSGAATITCKGYGQRGLHD